MLHISVRYAGLIAPAILVAAIAGDRPAAQAPAGNVLALANARVIDGTGRPALERGASVEAINDAFREAAESEELEGILGTSEEPLVSSDFIGTSLSSIVDLPLTLGMGDDFFKVVSWYDNEWGYAVRVADLAAYVGEEFDEE